MEMSKRPVLIAYDGSEFAKAAIKRAAEQLANGRRAIVLTVWHPYGGSFTGSPGDVPSGLKEEVRSDACRVADEGTKLARQEGFDAEPMVECGDPVWQRIVESADERDAGIVVIGSHGRTGITRVLIGSVADRVASHTDRPVLIVHAPDAEGR